MRRGVARVQQRIPKLLILVGVAENGIVGERRQMIRFFRRVSLGNGFQHSPFSWIDFQAVRLNRADHPSPSPSASSTCAHYDTLPIVFLSTRVLLYSLPQDRVGAALGGRPLRSAETLELMPRLNNALHEPIRQQDGRERTLSTVNTQAFRSITIRHTHQIPAHHWKEIAVRLHVARWYWTGGRKLAILDRKRILAGGIALRLLVARGDYRVCACRREGQ